MSGVWKEKQIVNNEERITEAMSYTLINHVKEDIILTADINANDSVIQVSAGHGFNSGDDIVIWDYGYFEQKKVKSVDGNTITVEFPYDRNFSQLNAIVIKGSRNININGSITPVIFQFKTYHPYECIDIFNMSLHMTTSTAPDDGKFGGLNALSNGLFVRQVFSGGYFNLGLYKANIDFRSYGGTIEYTNKGPGGINGININFRLPNIFGVVNRMSLTNDSTLTVKVQDDLSSLTTMTIHVQGHYTKGLK